MAGQKLHCKVTVRILTDKKAFGPGVAELLAGVRRHGSLLGAARQMGMSYSKAWTIIKEAEKIWGFPLTNRHAGGREGGHSRLTPQAELVLARYEKLVQEITVLADERFTDYFRDIRTDQEEERL